MDSQRKELSAELWLKFFNGLDLPEDLPLTLQGGEPSSYKGFFELLSGVKPTLKLDLLTNLCFDVEEFVKAANVLNFSRQAPYASIRVSFHPEQMKLDPLLEKMDFLTKNGFRAGLYMVNHPSEQETIQKVREKTIKKKIDFRLKDFLGFHQGKLLGDYRYDLSQEKRKVQCQTNEVLLSPEGNFHRCHRDLYQNDMILGNIESAHDFEIGKERICSFYGQCHPCDIKIKTNRFQEFGHTSVTIKDENEN